MTSGITILTRQALRRDRVMASAWTTMLVLMVYASAAATPGLYGTVQSRVQAAQAIGSSPATVALYGPILDPTSLGELSMTKMTVMYAVFVALLFVTLVRRHTRLDEEHGLAELVQSAPINRNAPYAAALVESLLLSAVLGIGTVAANIVGGLPIGGSVVFGFAWVGTALVATGIGAVAVQLSSSARTCGAIAIGTIVVLYVIRAIGDVSWNWLSWLSPFGWNTQLRPWSEPRWWVLGLYVVLALTLLVAAGLLRYRRDLGGGFLADRHGPASGSPRLSSPLALAMRVHRTSIVIWTVSSAVLGLLLGAIAPMASDLLDNDATRELFSRLGGPGAVRDALLAAELSIVAIAISCFGIAVATHAGEDERLGISEAVSATRTSRAAVWFGTAVVALVGGAWLMLVTGIAVAIGSNDGLLRITGAALAHVPAVWVATAVGLVAFGFGARFASGGWIALSAFLVLGVVGDLLDLPSWVTGISPFQHVPLLPSAAFSWGPEVGLIGAAALLVGFGWLRYRSRDTA
ncbi:ABC transporter permease [Smaragdicoccus niigatensis]|uniref:ABC transporter permease n=1 Tax=Smaragdicoccus niigatensis TaxID=359359 RepID=UPI00036EC70B|nr:hypothetical protein [Smaragdicoccus niigatensis]